VFEPLTTLTHLMATLVDPHGNITVPGITDAVAPLTEGERARYQGIDFSMGEFAKAAGCAPGPGGAAAAEAPVQAGAGQADRGPSGLLFPGDTEATLMHRWRYPTLSLHGVEGAFSDPGAKTVIPRTVVGKFSLRLVPHMEPAEIERLLRLHLVSEFRAIHPSSAAGAGTTTGKPAGDAFGNGLTMKLTSVHGAKAFSGDPDSENYRAAAAAVDTVWGCQPDLVRSGGSIPVTLPFQDMGKSVLLLPVGRGDDGAHSQNEKLDTSNYINGIKVMIAYLHECGLRLGK
jgi:Cys-Gly metallodipeptidase DUG1